MVNAVSRIFAGLGLVLLVMAVTSAVAATFVGPLTAAGDTGDVIAVGHRLTSLAERGFGWLAVVLLAGSLASFLFAAFSRQGPTAG